MYESISTVSENYWQDYQLHYDPFDSAITVQIFTGITHWEEGLDLLQHLCRYSNVLTCVTGEKGIGKTTFMEEMFSEVGESMQVYQITADENLDPRQLLEVLADGFSVDHEFAVDATLRECFDKQVEQIQENNKICLLLIDNAQTLPATTLETLFYLIDEQSNIQKRFHVILFGEPKLYTDLSVVAEEKFDIKLLHHLILKPLSLEETHDYIEHRLLMAGLKSNVPLTELELSRIYRLSNGYPERINRLAQQCLQENLSSRESYKTSFWHNNQTKLVGGAFVAFALAFVLVFLVGNGSHEGNDGHLYNHLSKRMDVAINQLSSNDLPKQDLDETTSPKKALETQDGTLQIASEQKAVDSSQAPEAKSQENKIEAIVNNAPKRLVKENTLVGATKPHPIAKHPIRSVEKTAINPQRYTLQIVAMKDKKQIQEFIHHHNMQGKVKTYISKRNGEKWIVLVYGSYKSAKQAKQEIQKLPHDIQLLKPWPRYISSLQAVGYKTI